MPKAASFLACALLVLGNLGSQIHPRRCTIHIDKIQYRYYNSVLK